MGYSAGMISVAVQGYGIVIWHGAEDWRTYAATASASAILAARVDQALRVLVPGHPSDEEVCAALLAIRGAHLFAVDCDHEPGECEGEPGIG
jgi:hypothetical protein